MSTPLENLQSDLVQEPFEQSLSGIESRISKFQQKDPNLSGLGEEAPETTGILEGLKRRINQMPVESSPSEVVPNTVFVLFIALSITIVGLIYYGSIYESDFYTYLITTPWLSAFLIATFLLSILLLKISVYYSFAMLLVGVLIAIGYYSYEFIFM